MRYDDITDVIGNTPLIRIDPAVHGLANIDLYAKMEMLNPFGSVKDRAAWAMARPLLAGARERGDTMVELSSGNTAKALAVIAGRHGLPFKSVTNRMKVPEIKELLLLLGAAIEELPGQAECLDPTDTEDPLTRMHQRLASTGTGYVHTDQYFNELNMEAHRLGTGPEIIKDLDGRAPDYFVACVGTAGSSGGVARALREHTPDTRVIGLVAGKNDFIPGIRTIDEVHEVGLFDPDVYDSLETVTAHEAIEGLLSLVRRSGILAGPTGGGAYFGALRHLRTVDAGLTERRTAVFIVCDRVESYLSYLRSRRPDLFALPARPDSVDTVTAAEALSAPAIGVAEARMWTGLVVDLRGPHAFRALHIDGSVNITDDVFAAMLAGGLPFSKSRPVLLVCPLGERSARYTALLRRMGHPSVFSLSGGVIAWRDAGAELVRD
ncbi:pyridoxal-phosphate dependent enzyme [Actinoplanes sp. TBRC 11911]|uniref:pyridoxal-phosphate dependent enzyme n=1 Tax=Actinoplanes sp. TBRC 11911 TaxID=2729386 RepID=UPI00145E0F5C|nr:pyridoxal-phosphate dependent enzyme [Actinoplanes sp. TBRC 11911]NMO53971.1 pyridoxal-phosphate dependent enzyme [Actinoplanes sp. TBRC 11911]